MLTRIKHISVLVPACNEEKLIARCLNSLLVAAQNIPKQVNIDFILNVDSSTDKTFEIGKKILAKQGHVVCVDSANVGQVRQLAAKAALERYSGPLQECWLANTDADCEVPIHWLSYQMHLAHQEVHCAAGIVKVDSFEEHDEQTPHNFLNHYLIHPDGSHPHVHGANLGIRADLYLEAGGWSPLKTGEDHDLWNRIPTHRTKLADAKLFVTTSGRRVGRAPAGFADSLIAQNGVKHG